jgi:hypothetical protein
MATRRSCAAVRPLSTASMTSGADADESDDDDDDNTLSNEGGGGGAPSINVALLGQGRTLGLPPPVLGEGCASFGSGGQRPGGLIGGRRNEKQKHHVLRVFLVMGITF